jgi:hypothetical protein
MGCSFWFAILLVIVGAWIWGSNHGIFTFSFYRDWPVLIIVVGVLIFIRILKRRRR